IVNRNPVRAERQVIGVQVADVLAGDVSIDLAGVEGNRVSRAADHLQRLQLSALRQVGRVVRNESVDETVRLLAVGVLSSGRAADVFDNDQIATPIGLDALITTATEYSGYVLDGGGKVERSLPDSTACTVFGR